MTVVVDDKQCIQVSGFKPGEQFDVHFGENGIVLLTPIPIAKLKKGTVRFEKENGRTVGVLDNPINEEALRQALEEFP